MSKPPYLRLVEHYTACFRSHGTTPRGVDWLRPEDAETRCSVMLAVIRPSDSAGCSVLDMGCGYGALKDYIDTRKLPYAYSGIDLSGPMVEAARKRHPGTSFELRDVLQDPLEPLSVDYVVMNGVLTGKQDLTFEQMESFAKDIIKAAFKVCRRGLAFNVMNKHVDWEREDLFHWPFHYAASFLKSEVSRHVVFRADYGLYEYTTYVYREPGR